MAWEPQKIEFVDRADDAGIQVSVEADGTVEVTYFCYDTAVTKHVVEHLTDCGMVHVTTVTRIQPGRYVPSFDMDV